jgi:hypothetical protein
MKAHPDLCLIGVLVTLSLALRLPYLFRPLHGDEQNTFSRFVPERDLGEILDGQFSLAVEASLS